MNAQAYTPSHHSMLTEWWLAHKWTPIPTYMLPPTGTVVYDGVTPVCAGFVYRTDSAIAWMEFIVSNPASTKDQRAAALDLLISDLAEKAYATGSTTIFTSSNQPSLIEKNKQQGFVVTDSNVTHMFRNK